MKHVSSEENCIVNLEYKRFSIDHFGLQNHDELAQSWTYFAIVNYLKRVGYLVIIGIELPQRYRICLGTETDVLAKE
jgi:hypothetical protein